jgi:hypothetical protein
MINNIERVDVIFRLFPDPEYFDNPGIEVIAFIQGYDCNPGMIMSYMHLGQHGEASIELINELKPCPINDALPLLRELESIGYAVNVVENFNDS